MFEILSKVHHFSRSPRSLVFVMGLQPPGVRPLTGRDLLGILKRHRLILALSTDGRTVSMPGGLQAASRARKPATPVEPEPVKFTEPKSIAEAIEAFHLRWREGRLADPEITAAFRAGWHAARSQRDAEDLFLEDQ